MSKLINFNKDYKRVTSGLRRAIASQAADILTAIKQQAYIHKNPDNNISEEDFAAMGVVLVEIVTEFNKLQPLVDDLAAVHTQSMTVDQLITKYTVDVDQYSIELEDAPVNWD